MISSSQKPLWLVCLMTVGLFLVLKAPMSVAPHNPEELRDFDHYLRASTGEKAYQDFVWIYGPLSPIVYGTAMKLLPPKLLSTRLFSLFLWCFGILFVTLLLSRYFASWLSIVAATLLCGGVLGYPSYSHNHTLVAVSLLGSAYFLIRYFEERRIGWAYASFVFVLAALYTRPVVMGYGAFFVWVLTFFATNTLTWRKRIFHGACFFAFFLVSLGAFSLYYGSSLKFGFLPLKWTILPFKGYPNIHYLIPYHLFGPEVSLFHLARLVRMSLETGMFYVHFFVWPVFLLTYVSLTPKTTKKMAALLLMVASVVASADLLHYGFTEPNQELALTVRGQFFIALTLISIVLIIWPGELRLRSQKVVASAGLLLLTLWAYFPWIGRAYHIASFEVNPHKVPILAGIYADPARSNLLLAAEEVDRRCRESDRVVVFGYFPGFRHLVKCQDPFARDAYAFTRMTYYKFVEGENPYVSNFGQRNDEFLKERLNELDPEFLVMEARSKYWTTRYCQGPEWRWALIGRRDQPLKVCWKKTVTQTASAVTP